MGDLNNGCPGKDALRSSLIHSQLLTSAPLRTGFFFFDCYINMIKSDSDVRRGSLCRLTKTFRGTPTRSDARRHPSRSVLALRRNKALVAPAISVHTLTLRRRKKRKSSKPLVCRGGEDPFASKTEHENFILTSFPYLPETGAPAADNQIKTTSEREGGGGRKADLYLL